MTYLEAAEAVLNKAEEPLHYKEITRRALVEGLVEPKGRTPEATMGAQLYMAVKRGQENWEKGVFRTAGRGRFGLVAPQPSSEIEVGIRTQNSKVEASLLDFLREMHPRQLELLVSRLLAAIGFEEVEVTRYIADEGIDVTATLTVGGVTRVRTAIQVKRWKQNVGGKIVRELRGSLTSDQRGLIITTGGYTSDAFSESSADGKTPISLIDGKRLIELLIEKEIGDRKKALPLLELNINDLLVEDDGGPGEKSLTLWPLPGGQEKFFETLLAFLDQIHRQRPTLDQLSAWVLEHYEKVTKPRLALTYLRAVLYSMGLVEFDGERVVLTADGLSLRSSRDRGELLFQIKKTILGVVEILEFLKARPATPGDILGHLTERLKLSWQTDQQVRYRIQWLSACGAVEREGNAWRLTRVGLASIAPAAEGD